MFGHKGMIFLLTRDEDEGENLVVEMDLELFNKDEHVSFCDWLKKNPFTQKEAQEELGLTFEEAGRLFLHKAGCMTKAAQANLESYIKTRDELRPIKERMKAWRQNQKHS